MNPAVALGSAILFGGFYLAVFRFMAKERQTITDGVKQSGRGIIREAQQLLGAIKAIKVHRAEELFLSRFRSDSALQSKLLAWMPLYQNGPRYLVEPLAFGGLVLVVLVYSAQGKDTLSLIPTLGVMALAGYRLLPSIQVLYGQATFLSTSRHALDEVYDEFIEIESSMDAETIGEGGRFSAPPAYKWCHSIALDSLSFRYPEAGLSVLENISLLIPKNSSLGIVGTTGSGKSTLVDLILGLHQPTTGKILIDGIQLTEQNLRAWRGGIGYVPQDIFLVDDTLAANIAFGVAPEDIDNTRLEKAASAAQILEFIHQLPGQWQHRVGERGVRLSGGQRQRIGLARALYHEPALLILDEATSALDTTTETEVMRSIYALQGSMTIIVIAHRLSTVERCQQILELASSLPSSQTEPSCICKHADPE